MPSKEKGSVVLDIFMLLYFFFNINITLLKKKNRKKMKMKICNFLYNKATVSVFTQEKRQS